MKTRPVFLLIILSLCTMAQAQPGPGGPPRDRPSTGSFSSSFLPATDREKAIFAVLDDMDRTQRRGSMSVPMEDGRILRLFTESTAAKHVVEIGTSIGYSGIWFCMALEQTQGKLTTFEIDEGRAKLARENFKRAGVDHLVKLMMGDAHQEVKKLKDPIDILFLDADKEGYLDYLNTLLPLLKPGGLVIAHNINPRQADPKFVQAITSNPQLETLFLNLQTSGISVSLKKRAPQTR